MRLPSPRPGAQTCSRRRPRTRRTQRSAPPRSDNFAKFFEDSTIEIETGTLLGRFVSEERDTARRLDSCYATLTGDKQSKKSAKSANKKSAKQADKKR